jgi:formamidopyrimidine-DNA glycosylase
MGAEPLDSDFTAEVLQYGAQRRGKSAIKACLLDQDVVAGVGNIYADEALYRAKIRPERRVRSLTQDDWHRLAAEIRAVLGEAVAAGGTTSDNYVDANGRQGAYAPRVYGRAKLPCQACGAVLTRIKVSGRGTVFCPRCQS